ncbi:MAG: hypothetical protein HKO01_12680 [Flaviramulus sp.]|nr:hypothetical protein [Flaviramulus sp.]NNC51377.1 hypothetical protein [Flaviramulus sp.]
MERNNNDLKHKSTKQLKSYLRVNTGISIVFIIALSIFTAFTIYGLISTDVTATYIALFAIACTSWSFAPILFRSVNNIKTELKLGKNPA